jgi:hypothetical protein
VLRVEEPVQEGITTKRSQCVREVCFRCHKRERERERERERIHHSIGGAREIAQDVLAFCRKPSSVWEDVLSTFFCISYFLTPTPGLRDPQ